ncbi:MAG: ferrous iron transport protein A [Candidatus Bathyarchaeota archaeon]|nr:ferrous iron transport protein A [Candidatus Bathyarchaeota archaeon]MCX8178127.1 ferrous iron transport protein A [Candidatus Bathyarchaeota archaeon]MDW8194428.1 FeoA family protein [Nitrososphaerota archaeon]
MASREDKKALQGSNKNDGLTVLADVAEGEKCIVVKALGSFGLVRRLTEMGLTPGTEIKLLRKGILGGPVEIEVRGVALILGREVASRVLVKPVKEEQND